MLPPPFLERMECLLGDEYPAFLASYDQPRTHGLRANTLKISPEELRRRIAPLEPVPWAPDGFYFPDSLRPGRHPYHAAGLYYIQEPSAMAAAPLLGPQPGERVLDLCAAPGGKTTHLAALMTGRGLLLANEIHPKRARILLENLERTGVTCAAVTCERPDRLAERLPGFFDRILVDAPCSGEGMFRKLPEACEEWSPGSPRACSFVQREILDSAVAMLRPGGRLLYSTCTFAPDENEEVLLHLLRRHPEMEILDLPPLPGLAPARPDWTEAPDEARRLGVQRGGRLWPHRLRGEGHFVALLRKADGEVAVPEGPRRKGRPERPGREAMQLLARFWEEALTAPLPERLLQHGSWLYVPPEDMPDLSGLHVLRTGLQLGEVRKGRFEPAHALALALGPGQARQVHNLAADSDAVHAYLRGEALPASGESGWTLMTMDGFPLGWAKASGGLLKNHYPKGLRWLESSFSEA